MSVFPTIARIDTPPGPSAPTRRAPLASARRPPLLSRVADSLFWLGRYAERFEQTARALRVVGALLTDVGDLAPALLRRQWHSLTRIAAVADLDDEGDTLGYGPRVARYLALDLLNPGSIAGSVTRARENARAVRSELSVEVWRGLNALYWSVQSDELRARFDENADEVLEGVMQSALMFAGAADGTLDHDQRWQFLRCGRALERAEFTVRILAERLELLDELGPDLEAPLRNNQLFALLRMCCCMEGYRRQTGGVLDAARIAEFILLGATYPRSVLFNVAEAGAALVAVREETTTLGSVDQAERTLGRLAALLRYGDADDLSPRGAATLARQVQRSLHEAAAQVQQTYFLK